MAERMEQDLNIIQRSGIEIQVDPLTKDLNIIQQLDDEPNDVGGLSAAELKAKFDEAGNTIKAFINDSLIPQVLGADATEAAREAAETAREAAESARSAAETARETAESARVSAETARETAEAARETAEAGRDSAEVARAAAEEQREFNNAGWGNNEVRRMAAEKVRQAAESARVSAETARETAETARETAETIRVGAETAREAAEAGRDSAEAARAAAEKAREVWEAYDGGKSYVPGNKVYYLGSSYVNTVPCQGVLPTDAEHWQIVAERGMDGGGMCQDVADGRYLQLSGGTMTGALEVLSPTENGNPATKWYVDKGFLPQITPVTIRDGLYALAGALTIKKGTSYTESLTHSDGLISPVYMSSTLDHFFHVDVDGYLQFNREFSMDAHKIVAVCDPENDSDAATKWYVDRHGVPSGGIILWSGSADNIPAGWLLCDGENGTPDLRDRFVLGAGTVHSVGETGGEEEHKLTVNEMPQHRHSVTLNAGTGYSTNLFSAGVSSSSGGTGYTNNVGGNTAHNNMPPYYTLCYIMREFEPLTPPSYEIP